jgi:hypothetical protein
MPIEQAIWKLGESPERLNSGKLQAENELEDAICKDISVLSDQWLLIGRQIPTSFNGIVDLLAIDSTGSLIIIELKKDKTPREVVAQAIDYASWVQNLDGTEIADIFERFCQKYLRTKLSLDQAYSDKFGSRLMEDDLNSSHQMIVVATELDSSSERIIKYLSDRDIAINAVFFHVFIDKEIRYLSRAWFIDPTETQVNATSPKATDPWNGEYYVSFGDKMGRDWDYAMKYGFISGGGGRWYSQTLKLLKEGDRVWVNIPRIGYVGVGVVKSTVVKVDQFYVKTDQGEVPLFKAPIHADYLQKWVNDDNKAEYVVKIEWLHAVTRDKAISELGLFGNQNTVCRPTTSKWPHTIERLKTIFKITK